MKKLCLLALVAAIATTALVLPGAAADQAAKVNSHAKLKVLVIAGGHPYPVAPFRAIFKNYADMDCTFVEEKKGGEALNDISHWSYDAILLYNYQKILSPKQRENFLTLMDRGVGLVVLHHAIYGYRRDWPEYQKIVGVTSWLTGSKDGVDLTIHVADPKHPITKGLRDFPICDETYIGHELAPGMHVILSTDAPNNSKHVAWVHTYRQSPVCYLQLGHDNKAYANPQYVAVLGQAIRWVAGRLPKED